MSQRPVPLTSRRLALRRFVLGGFGLAVVACSAPPPAPTSAPTQVAPPPAPTAVPTKPVAPAPSVAPSPAVKAPTQAPTRPKVEKIALAQSSPGFAFVPVQVAREREFFEDEAIDVEVQLFQGVALAITSTVSGETQLAAVTADGHLAAREKGLDLLAVVATTTALTQEFAARNEFMQSRGVTPQSPLKDKISALKGSKIGVGTLTGAGAELVRYVLRSNGIDPAADAELVAVGQASARIAALRQGQVDLFVGDAPDPEVAENEGGAAVFLTIGSELEIFKQFIFLAFAGKRDWIEQNANVVQRVARAIGRGNNLIRNDLPTAKEAIRIALPSLNNQVLDRAIGHVKDAYSEDGRMTELMWKNAATVWKATGTIKEMPSTAEGTFWTNKYLVDVPKR